MNILLTGARAPVTLDLARHLAAAGHRVDTADSLRFPICRFSRVIDRHFDVPPPAYQFAAYIAKLKEIVVERDIDLVVPTCEEVFYISGGYAQEGKAFCDALPKLKWMHDKFTFIQQSHPCGLQKPETHLLESIDDAKAFLERSQDWVFKPVFSRFATHALIGPTAQKAHLVLSTVKGPWLAQRRIEGQEFCSYSIAYKGRLTAHACYYSRYRFRQKGSGIYFEAIDHHLIREYVARFVAAHQFHGQIGFDFMQTQEGDVYVLECNPRATSGVHLFGPESGLAKAFMGENQTLIQPQFGRLKMIAPAMILFQAPHNLIHGGRRQFIRDFLKAGDSCFQKDDARPGWLQMVSLLEMVGRSLKHRTNLKDAITADIEWNGESF